MKPEMKRLPEAELQVMLAVWQCGDKSSASDILSVLNKDWALPTLMTVLSRLSKKGYLFCEKQGRNNVYHILITEETYQQMESKTLLENLFHNSFQSFVTTLYNGKHLKKSELDELRTFLDRLESEDKK